MRRYYHRSPERWAALQVWRAIFYVMIAPIILAGWLAWWTLIGLLWLCVQVLALIPAAAILTYQTYRFARYGEDYHTRWLALPYGWHVLEKI